MGVGRIVFLMLSLFFCFNIFGAENSAAFIQFCVRDVGVSYSKTTYTFKPDGNPSVSKGSALVIWSDDDGAKSPHSCINLNDDICSTHTSSLRSITVGAHITPVTVCMPMTLFIRSKGFNSSVKQTVGIPVELCSLDPNSNECGGQNISITVHTVSGPLVTENQISSPAYQISYPYTGKCSPVQTIKIMMAEKGSSQTCESLTPSNSTFSYSPSVSKIQDVRTYCYYIIVNRQ